MGNNHQLYHFCTSDMVCYTYQAKGGMVMQLVLLVLMLYFGYRLLIDTLADLFFRK